MTMHSRILLLPSALLLAIVAIACETDPRPVCDDDPFAYTSLTATPRELTLRSGGQGTIALEFMSLCRTPDYGSYDIGDVDLLIDSTSFFPGLTPSFSITDLKPNSQTGRISSTMTIRNDSAAPGRYVITVVAYSQQLQGLAEPRTRGDSLDITVIVPEITSSPCAPWTEVTGLSGTEAPDYRDLQFIAGSETGYLSNRIYVGGIPQLHRTTDGGRTWRALTITSFVPDRLSFADENNGIVSTSVAGGTHLYRTTNGGTSWDQLMNYSGADISDILLVSSTTGFITATNMRTVMKTEDGGNTWRSIALPHSVGRPWAITSPAADLLVVAGEIGLARSTDGGASWEASTAPEMTYLWVDFFDADNGIAGGSLYLVRTTDGGATWEKTESTPLRRAGGAARPGGSTGYAVGQSIWETTDRGATWRQHCTPSGAFFSMAEIASSGRAVAAGSAVYRRDP